MQKLADIKKLGMRPGLWTRPLCARHQQAKHLPVGEPLDWMETPLPDKWKLNGRIVTFDWS